MYFRSYPARNNRIILSYTLFRFWHYISATLLPKYQHRPLHLFKMFKVTRLSALNKKKQILNLTSSNSWHNIFWDTGVALFIIRLPEWSGYKQKSSRHLQDIFVFEENMHCALATRQAFPPFSICMLHSDNCLLTPATYLP